MPDRGDGRHVTLSVGVACLLAFVAVGVAVIASPGFLAGEDEDDAG